MIANCVKNTSWEIVGESISIVSQTTQKRGGGMRKCRKPQEVRKAIQCRRTEGEKIGQSTRNCVKKAKRNLRGMESWE